MSLENMDATSRSHRPLERAVVESRALLEHREDLEDLLFDQYMKQHLTDGFFEDLEEYLTEEHVEEVRSALAAYSDSEIIAAVAIPYELRDRLFSACQRHITEGKKTPKAFIADLVHRSQQEGYGIGYHTSPVDIQPNPRTNEWSIQGTEKDHRDNDLTRAYYSSKFKHLYKAKGDGFIYVVRTHPENKTDGNWSRASLLSVIMRVPFREVYDYVTETVTDMEQKKSS